LATRTLLLVRHGQYAVSDGGRLTDLGRQQARVTGEWLASQIDAKFTLSLWSSTLPRARETAAIVSESLAAPALRSVGVLREGIYSKIRGYELTPEERAEDRARADLAYAKFFRTSRAERTDVLVCHGNLIRYLLCRAIDVPPSRWVRMISNHCSVTRILVRGAGTVRVVSYNETAHLPPNLVT
jgi:serine/threonine-protein phosphatase PGAM5